MELEQAKRVNNNSIPNPNWCPPRYELVPYWFWLTLQPRRWTSVSETFHCVYVGHTIVEEYTPLTFQLTPFAVMLNLDFYGVNKHVTACAGLHYSLGKYLRMANIQHSVTCLFFNTFYWSVEVYYVASM